MQKYLTVKFKIAKEFFCSDKNLIKVTKVLILEIFNIVIKIEFKYRKADV